jgi:hypothetical protein
MDLLHVLRLSSMSAEQESRANPTATRITADASRENRGAHPDPTGRRLTRSSAVVPSNDWGQLHAGTAPAVTLPKRTKLGKGANALGNMRSLRAAVPA